MRKIIYLTALIIMLVTTAKPVWFNVNTHSSTYNLPNPLIYNERVIYNPSQGLYAEAGWQSFDTQTEITTNVTEIPAQVQQLAGVYKATLEKYFGEGAVTNTSITYDYVSMYFLSQPIKTVDMVADAILLKELLETLKTSGFCVDNNIFTFPYGQTSIETIVEKQYFEYNGVRYYP